MRPARLALLLCLGACASAPVQEPPMPRPATDFCAHALEALGLTDATLASCTALLPDLYWVNATGPGGFAGAVVVEAGVPVKARGCGAGAAWLTRIGVQDLPAARAVFVTQGLEALGALPDGFTSAHVAGDDDPSGDSRLTLKPFRLELVAPEEPTGFEAGALDAGGLGGPGHTPGPERRAVLTADPAWRFTWTIERRTAGGPWEPVSSTPCE